AGLAGWRGKGRMVALAPARPGGRGSPRRSSVPPGGLARTASGVAGSCPRAGGSSAPGTGRGVGIRLVAASPQTPVRVPVAALILLARGTTGAPGTALAAGAGSGAGSGAARPAAHRGDRRILPTRGCDLWVALGPGRGRSHATGSRDGHLPAGSRDQPWSAGPGAWRSTVASGSDPRSSGSDPRPRARA